jgi:hypothetical protein
MPKSRKLASLQHGSHTKTFIPKKSTKRKADVSPSSSRSDTVSSSTSVAYSEKEEDQVHEHRVFFKDFPKFSGQAKEDYEEWWAHVLLFFKQFKISEKKKILVVNSGVSGVPRTMLDSSNDIKSLEDIDDFLRPIFDPKINKVKKLVKTKQETDDSVSVFAA